MSYEVPHHPGGVVQRGGDLERVEPESVRVRLQGSDQEAAAQHHPAPAGEGEIRERGPGVAAVQRFPGRDAPLGHEPAEAPLDDDGSRTRRQDPSPFGGAVDVPEAAAVPVLIPPSTVCSHRLPAP